MTADAAQRPAPFTYSEYCLWPDDGRRHELIDGDFVVTPAPSPHHQTVSRRLQYRLMQALEEPGLAQIFDAPIDLILDEHTVVQPDLVVVGAAKTQLITGRGIEGPPDLVVEILSPGSIDRDTLLKRGLYERFGIPEYWVVDPQNAVVVAWRLQGARYEERARYGRADTLVWDPFPQVRVGLSAVFG